MAEAWAKALKGDVIEAYSAGVEPKGIDARAVKAMAEVGIDISNYKSKDISALENVTFDYVITLCDHAHQTCPIFPGTKKQVHWSFEDPPRLAQNAESEEEAMTHYRRIRDEIKAFVKILPQSIEKEKQELFVKL